MSPRVCFLGNSHLAALKISFEPSGPHNFEATWFGAPAQLLGDLEVKGQTLTPSSGRLALKLAEISGGQSTIPVSEYDIFVMVGMGLSIRWLFLQLLKQFRSTSYEMQAPTYLVSDDCLQEAANGLIHATLVGETLAKLREITAAPVVIVPQPMPAVTLLADEEKRMIFRDLIDAGDADRARLLFETGAVRLAERFNAEFLPQPSKTIADGILTQIQYTTGSVRLSSGLDIEHPPQDYGHMNALYGSEIWASLQPLLAR